MDPFPVFAILVAGVLIAAFVLVRRGAERSRARRQLNRVSRTDIGSTAEGPAKIAGILKLSGAPLHAPLSGRACAVYDVLVTERQNHSHRVIVEERFALDFFLDDGTGTALVKPGTTIELAIVQDGRYSSGLFEDATQALELLLAKYGESSKGHLLMNRVLRYREGVFEPGERVVVYGCARREAAPGAATSSYRESGTRLILEPLEGRMVLSDEPAVAGESPAQNEDRKAR